jgi:glycerophosphoryl diester phosphodiesterase
MQIWTHRGNPAPENTLEAFSKAWSDGIRCFETDIHCTRDGVLVLAHDPDISRLTGVNELIRNLTLEQLQGYEIDGKFTWATLDQLVSQFPEARISIDIKSNGATAPFIAWLQGKSHKNLIVGSFSTRRVNQVRQAFPVLTTALTTREIFIIRTGFGFFLPSHSASRVAMVPIRFKGLTILTDYFLRFCKKKSIEVNVWTINTLEECLELRKRGVSGIVTDDYPGLSAIAS